MIPTHGDSEVILVLLVNHRGEVLVIGPRQFALLVEDVQDSDARLLDQICVGVWRVVQVEGGQNGLRTNWPNLFGD